MGQIDEVLRNLADVIAWCEPRANSQEPASCLRTEGFHLKLRDLPVERKVVGWEYKSLDLIVPALIGRRRRALADGIPTPSPGLHGGRLLVCERRRADSSGASAVASQQYLDYDDAPPWDTWVCHFRGEGTILSWVPPCFFAHVEKGIDVNPMDCIWWLDSRKTELSGVLLEVLEETGRRE